MFQIQMHLKYNWFHLKILFNISKFKPALNWNRFLADLRRGSNSLNSDHLPYMQKLFLWVFINMDFFGISFFLMFVFLWICLSCVLRFVSQHPS